MAEIIIHIWSYVKIQVVMAVLCKMDRHIQKIEEASVRQEETLRRIEDAVTRQHEFTYLFLFSSIDLYTATYSNCIINDLIITCVQGNYNHYHLNESSKFIYAVLC